MIKSMTGYGKSSGGGYTVEMRSVNHKFLDVSVKMPREVLALEARLKKAAGDRLSRGRVDVFINRDPGVGGGRNYSLNREAADQYVSLLRELKDSFGLDGEVDLGLLASFREIVTEDEASEDLEDVWTGLSRGVNEALDSLAAMRAEEGSTLYGDILSRADSLLGMVDAIEARSPEVVKAYAERLRERVAELAEGVGLDEARLAQEVALMAERSDITEEVVRFRSHISQLRDMLDSDGPVGRKMDFLMQELNREANTMGSKSPDTEIAHTVVEIKAELEKIREQVQNVE